MLQIFGREPGLNAANVTVREPRLGVNGTGQETYAKRTSRNKADAQFLAQRDYLFFWPTPQHRIFVLNRAHG